MKSTGLRPLTILHLAANRWWTGSAEPVTHLVAGLRSRGHRVLLSLVHGDRFEAKARDARLELVDGVSLDTGAAPLALMRDVARLHTLVRVERVDLVHAHHSHDHWLAWAVAGRRVPVVRTFHNRRAVKRAAAARWLYRRTAAMFAVSREVEACCVAAGVPRARVVWIPGSVDLDRFTGEADARAIREEFKLGDAPVVVSVARFAANRGHEALLAGFRRLLDGLPNARLLLVGKGERRVHLETLTGELGLGDRVLFTGYRDRDLPDVLAAADCFVLMASGSDESCRAALEAMAAGRPVVAARAGALPEIVVHGETGLLLDDTRPESIASALRAALADRDRARFMGRAARRRAEEAFAPARAVDTVETVYRSLL